MGLIFFFLRVYCFILKWQLSPLLPLECLPVHLDCHSLWPPGLSGGSRRLAALLRESRGAERQKQRWLWVGRRLKHIKAGSQREERGHCFWLTPQRRPSVHWVAVHLPACLPACAFLGDKHNKYYSLHTVYSSGHQPPHTGSSLRLCSYLAGRVGGGARICF